MPFPHHPAPLDCPICGRRPWFSFKENFASDTRWSLYECGACAVQFWLPLVLPQGTMYEEEVAYQGKGEVLTRSHARAIAEGYWNVRQFLRGFPALRSNTTGKALLDIGCGTGEFMFVARELGYSVHGIDFNKHAVNFARERLGLEGAVTADLYAYLSARKERYDVITAFEVIEHVPDPGAFLDLVRESLSYGGILVISTPNRNRYWGRIDPVIDTWDYPYQHLTRWSPRSLMDFAERHGFATTVFRRELPVEWFIGKLKRAALFFMGRPRPGDARTVSERVRGGVGFSRYQCIKRAVVAVCAVPAWILFLFGFEGIHMYAVFQRKY